MISLLVPTRARPQDMESFAVSVDETVGNPESVEIVFGIDEDDALSLDKAQEMSRHLRIQIKARLLTPWLDGHVNLSYYWNQCYEAATHDIVGFFGDDTLFKTFGWDLEIQKLLVKDPTLMIGVNGIHHPKTSWGLPDPGWMHFTHKKVHNLFGYYCYEPFRRYCMDSMHEFIFRRSGRYLYRKDLVMEHLQASTFTDKIDETHLRMSKWIDQDFALFQTQPIKNEIIRCSDLLNDMVLKFKKRKGTDILQKRSRRR